MAAPVGAAICIERPEKQTGLTITSVLPSKAQRSSFYSHYFFELTGSNQDLPDETHLPICEIHSRALCIFGQYGAIDAPSHASGACREANT